jgi:hypothetical protein
MFDDFCPPSPPPLWWPIAQPTDSKPYSLSTFQQLEPIADAIVQVELSIKPSGIGELQASDLTTFINPNYPLQMTAYDIGVRLTGGVAGREYTIMIIVTTFAGNEFTYIIGLPISRVLASFPLPPSPNPGFGPVLTLQGAAAAASIGSLTSAGAAT